MGDFDSAKQQDVVYDLRGVHFTGCAKEQTDDHTYPVAWALAQDELAVEGCTEPLPAGRLLVFGGDQVYPVASDD